MMDFTNNYFNESFISTHHEDRILYTNLEYWMTELPPYLKTIPIIHLAIPGSHNTMTYTINRFNNVGPDEPYYLQFLGKYFSIISRPIIFNWSVTQYESVIQQLNGGIRYLDLRLASKPTDNEIYFVHGLFGDEVSQHLINISNWLVIHSSEIIIIDCQHFYAFSDEHHHYFLRKIKSIFGNMICPAIFHLLHINLDWMIKRKYQVILIYRNEIAKTDYDLWPTNLWPTPWPNTTRPRALIDFLNIRLKTRLPDTGFISQCLLTPDTKFVLKHFCGSLNRDLGAICRKATIRWIYKNSPGSGGLNIVITDFISYDNFLFSKIVIQRNVALLEEERNTRTQAYSKDQLIGSEKGFF
ncbi:PI-PLC X domain-containing protein 3 [Chelonus insularis]|uniref:PI-PLC X domain-containing protein 3 n=1 Tax=Chelonus insularis TaxID=460826 RepID=UPI00158EADF4|nr:PI-PLC X domain-containing protein 3 [Chelonus insularis]